jgi:hypothetical protein
MDKEIGTLELDSALRLSLALGDHARQSVQLNRDDARRLGIALIEIAGRNTLHLPSVASPIERSRDGT